MTGLRGSSPGPMDITGRVFAANQKRQAELKAAQDAKKDQQAKAERKSNIPGWVRTEDETVPVHIPMEDVIDYLTGDDSGNTRIYASS